MMLRSLLRLAAVFSVPLLVASLTGGCDSGSDDDSAVSLEQLPAQLAAAQCEVRRRCAGPQEMIHLGSVEYCQESLGDNYSDNRLPPIAAAVAAGTVIYHGERVRECMEHIRSLSCSSPELDSYGPCEGVFEGTVAAGGTCSVAEECAGDSYCDNRAACPGTCAPMPGQGEPCDGWQLGRSCQVGLDCVSSQSGSTCEPLQPEGGACKGEDCQGMLTCSGATETTPGTCVTWDSLRTADVGQKCDLDTVVCKTGLSCTAKLVGSDVEFLCQPGVAAGAKCMLAYPSQCPDGQHCLHTNLLESDIEGTCGAPAKPGQDCYYWQSPCEPDAQCNNKCVAVKDVGSPCEDDGDCHSYNCKDKLCAPREACQL